MGFIDIDTTELTLRELADLTQNAYENHEGATTDRFLEAVDLLLCQCGYSGIRNEDLADVLRRIDDEIGGSLLVDERDLGGYAQRRFRDEVPPVVAPYVVWSNVGLELSRGTAELVVKSGVPSVSDRKFYLM